MIYVLCPADVKTGGTELLHQLVKTLTDVKVPAGIVYTDSGAHAEIESES